MLIENRIKKRNETDSCNDFLVIESHREKLVIRIVKRAVKTARVKTNLVKRFFRKSREQFRRT